MIVKIVENGETVANAVVVVVVGSVEPLSAVWL
jgi:hypothetical protein